MAEISGVQFTPASAPGGALGAQAAAPQLGVAGGQPLQTRGLAAREFFTAGMGAEFGGDIPGFLQEAFEPALSAAKQQRRWDGFVKAREGASMAEISESQPWYTRVFGPTDYEMGAQMYTAQKAVADTEADFMRRMPELRQLNAEELSVELNRMNQSLLTGNKFSDAIVQRSFMERASTMADAHAKHRTAWLEGEQVRLQSGAIGSAMTAYQESVRAMAKLGSAGPMDPKVSEGMVAAKLSLADSMGFSRYQTDESKRAVLMASIRGAADRGEFFATKFLIDGGALNYFDPQTANDLKNYVLQQESQHKATFLDQNPEYAERMALVSLYAAEGIGAVPTAQQIAALNDEYAALTGSSTPMYSGSNLASAMAQSAGNHIQAQEADARRRAERAARANTEQEKLAAQQEDIQGGIDAWRAGTYSQAINVPGVDKELLDANVLQSWNKTRAANPQVALGQLVWNANTGRGAVLKGVADQYQTTARAVLREQPNKAAEDLYNEWRALKDTKAQRLDANGNPVEGRLTGATTAALYFGDAVNTMFNRLQALQESGVDFQLAYEVARGEITTADPTQFNATSRKESEATQARVSDVLATANPKYLGFIGNRLGKSGRDAAARVIVRAVTESGGLLDTSEEGLKAALDHAKLKYGGEDAGKYYWENGRDDEGHAIRGVGAWLGFLDTKETGPAIEAAIDAALRAHNIEPSADLKTDIFRMRDSEKGEPVLYVNTVGERGWKVVPVTGAEIKAEYEKRSKARTKREPLPITPMPRAGGRNTN